MSNDKDKDKLIQRARKLYAMSNDTSSPEEAAIALKRVTSMMEQHGITAEDLEQNRTQFGTANYDRVYSQLPAWYSVLLLGVARYHDCNVSIRRGVTRFEGFDKDALIAPLTLDYLVQTMERGVKRYQKERKEVAEASPGNYGPSPRKLGSSFRRGYASEMQEILCNIATDRKKEQEAAIKESGGTALVVQKKSLVEGEFGKMRVVPIQATVMDNAASAGAAGARNTNLNSQLTGSRERSLL